MKIEGEAVEWYETGKADGEAGRPPQSVLDGEIPVWFGAAYNLGYRAGGGPWTYVFNGKPETPRGA